MRSPTRKLFAKRQMDVLIRRYAIPLRNSGEPFWRLIHAVRASSRLLAPFSERGRTDPHEAERIVRACARMARRCDAWRRLPEEWIAPDANPFVQFHSLVRYLFDEFPVPRFMAPVWLDGHEKPWELNMYLHLARGKSIRRFELPLSYPHQMTKRAARFFMRAPDDIRPISAYRWAHVRSLGGDGQLARLLSSTPPLFTPTEHEGFWESLIRFVVTNQPICTDETVAIVRFVDQQRFQPAETVWGPGSGQRPVQPDFTVRGRSLRSNRRHMANWQTDLAAKLSPLDRSVTSWERTGIRPFRHAEGNTLWTIDEILTDRELRVEAGIMQHCVASYIHDCARRRTSIWSMKVQEGKRRKRTLTIEVLPKTRTIWAANGKRNSPPSAVAREMLDRWADQEKLSVSV